MRDPGNEVVINETYGNRMPFVRLPNRLLNNPMTHSVRMSFRVLVRLGPIDCSKISIVFNPIIVIFNLRKIPSS